VLIVFGAAYLAGCIFWDLQCRLRFPGIFGAADEVDSANPELGNARAPLRACWVGLLALSLPGCLFERILCASVSLPDSLH